MAALRGLATVLARRRQEASMSDPKGGSGAAAARVLVAGAGPAALEFALALREWAGNRARITILAPGDRFVYPPFAVMEPFAPAPALTRPLPIVVAAARAELRRGALAAVEPQRRMAITDAGERIPYDYLVVAVGARTRPALPAPVVTFAGIADVGACRSALERTGHRALGGEEVSLAFVVPPGAGWPLPAYELAFAAKRHLDLAGASPLARVSIVTAEERPLDIFGERPSDAVARDLTGAGIGLRTGAPVRGFADGALRIIAGPTVRADEVIALPHVSGPSLPGLPSDGRGFIRTRPDGRVGHVEAVWAIGDAAAFPIKQGGIACQQADAAAAAVAAQLDVEAPAMPFDPVVRGALWLGDGYRYMRSEPAGGRDESLGVTSTSDPLWHPAEKIAGRFLPAMLGARPIRDELTDRASRG
jgi:sulfide:quinone oxidoreductase